MIGGANPISKVIAQFLNENTNVVLETRAVAQVKALLILNQNYKINICRKNILPSFGASKAENDAKIMKLALLHISIM